jgi:methyltransferase (TIGR00027 family)
VARIDNDSWDLATSVGATATMVAAARARASSGDHPLIDDPFAEPLVRAVGVDFLTRWADGELDIADVDGPDAPWGLQRMTDLLGARTRYFDAFCSDAAAAGIRQFVILASGLDARAYRLSWPAQAGVFEIDQPAVIAFKTKTIAGLGVTPSVDLHAVPIDLRHDWPAALRAAGFTSERPTAWLAEGLLPFLPPQAQDQLLDSITALSGPGSRLASEIFNPPTEDNGPDAALMMQRPTDRWRAHGFDLDFSELTYEGERNDVAAYLADHGWSSTSTLLPQLFAEHGLPPIPDEHMPMAQNSYCTSILG